MDLDLSELNEIVLDKEMGVDIGRGPFLLTMETFVDLLSSRRALNADLNNLIPQSAGDYFHIAKYKNIDFLSYGPNQIFDE